MPPNCRAECVISSECPQNKACVNQKCTDPCVGVCGENAICKVVNHNAICSCSSGFTGEPFNHCKPIESKNLKLTIIQIKFKSKFPLFESLNI